MKIEIRKSALIWMMLGAVFITCFYMKVHASEEETVVDAGEEAYTKKMPCGF